MSIRQGVRVGFTGAGGTGKTTSANYLSEELGLGTFPSASRVLYEERDLSEEKVQTEFSNEERLKLQFEIFAMKVKQDTENFSYVTDRTLLDHWAYCLAYCGGFMENDQFLQFETTVRAHMKSTYSHIFYFPWGYFEPGTDGVRQDRKSWQSQIDALIVGYSFRWNLPVIEVPQLDGKDVRNEFIKGHVLGRVPVQE